MEESEGQRLTQAMLASPMRGDLDFGRIISALPLIQKLISLNKKNY
jgi:hypothetical protein